MTDEVLSALDLAVFERRDDGTLVLAAEPPPWLSELGIGGNSDPLEAFPFLEAFLVDAESVRQSSGRRLDSDVWVQNGPRGTEYALQASAVLVLNRRLIVVRLLGAEFERRRLTLQSARQTQLSYERLADAKQGLEIRNLEMERVNQLKSEFLANMSHELRTPLNSIVGFSSLLAEEGHGPLNAEQKGYVEHVRRSARHLLDLINDIIDLSRIEAGRLELCRETFSLVDALNDVLATIRPLADAKAIRLHVEYEPGCLVYADRVRFKQILFNLLSNAIKFTPRNGWVSTSSVAQGNWLAITIGDTGIGIPKQEQTAIFEKFHQVGAGASGAREGAGLGLAITKGLVEQHDGRVWVQSQPGQGSRFTFVLPYTAQVRADTGEDEPCPRAPSAAPPADPSQGKKIAVVEDSPSNRALFLAMLEPPHQVALYGAGSEALEAFARERPDIVLLDIGLPGMDGMEVLRRIRADPSLRSLPVVAVSAYAMAGDRERFLSAGFDAYLPKPIAERSVLLEAIAPFLSAAP
jgi:signal transduction histidine kinase